jgi:hypothetical protein
MIVGTVVASDLVASLSFNQDPALQMKKGKIHTKNHF